ncbi:hypothetical protein IWW36_001785 [Coemansia brasiliensis]|uniref:WW domain-containing protein n=1 Tax=Coemansia brasiliensis TaxID=2650707 RepID=A0A9W8IH71_9FUNG|nr:hypothetical protein IWW36_001785 [Coemansia brasiliensis]
MEFPSNRPPVPLPEVLYATGHNWAVFLAPPVPKGQHVPNEPYYYERNNGITTWIRPFDYIEPSDPQAALQIGEKWKREKEEQKRQAARKQAKKDRPIRQQHIAGTVWRRVETRQKRVFYYNNDTKESRWDTPPELADNQLQSQTDNAGREEGTEMNVDDAEWMLAQMQQDEDDMSDEADAATQPQDTSSREANQEDERIAKLDKPGKVSLFKSMLYEAQVNPFGMWDTELSKFAHDWRLAAVTDRDERQDLFDSVCREIVQQRNQQKQSAAKDDASLAASTEHPFDQLLREKVIKKISFAKFCQRNLKDPRYLSIKTSREREKRFNKHMESLQAPK